MKTTKYESREDWEKGRKGRITGSGLGDVVSTAAYTKDAICEELTLLDIPFTKYQKKEELEALLPEESKVRLEKNAPRKIGYYKIVADRLKVDEDRNFSESPMDRGTRLESESMKKLSENLGRPVDTSLVIWERDDDKNISCSPDGILSEIECAETKSLSSEKHIKAYLTQQIPEEYEEQVIQHFIVNENLQMIFFCMYDPSIGFGLDFFYIEITRGEVEEQVQKYLETERWMLAEIDEIVMRLTF